MLKNYFKIGLRQLYKHKLFSFINIFGLAVSLSFCLLVIVIINDQNSFDRFHPREQDVYRLLTAAHRKSGDTERYATTPRPLGEVLQRESPAVEKLVQLTRGISADARFGQTTVPISGFFTSAEFFEVFGFTFAQGDAATALQLPNSLVLTSEMAAKLFGSEEPMGKIVQILGLTDFIVTGVLQPFPGKTHLEFDALGSSEILPLLEKNEQVMLTIGDWKNYYGTYTFLRLHPGQHAEELQPLLADIPSRVYGELELESRDRGYSFELQPLTKITPGPMLSNSVGKAMPDVMLIFLSVLALLGMTAALFNYTNLTLARSLNRAKEVGIRKVTGAARRQVFVQFLGESVLLVLLALLAAEILLRVVLIPGFMQLEVNSSLSIDFIIDFKVYALFFGFAVLIGIFAGLLPAALMSAFRPVQVLKSFTTAKLFSRINLRRALIVFQFVLSLVFIITTVVVYRQIDFALQKDYGFTKENMIVVKLQGNSPELVAQKLAQHSEVSDYSLASHNLGTWEDSAIDVRKTTADEPVGVRDYSVDARFVKNFGLTLLAGRNFDANLAAGNENHVIVNQRFLERFELGTPADAIGNTLILGDTSNVRITGVLQDFIFKPLTYQLEPMLLRYVPEKWNDLHLKIHGKNVAAALSHFEEGWKSIDPVHPFAFTFYDDLLQQVYSMFQDMMFIIGFLAVLAFTISVLGLLGIATFNAETRVKEVGIRKIMGASPRQLVVLLSRTDMILLSIAVVIAVPAALGIGSMLLQEFAFHIDLGVNVVLPGVLAILLFGGLTTGWQAVRAALSNPAEALRYE